MTARRESLPEASRSTLHHPSPPPCPARSLPKAVRVSRHRVLHSPVAVDCSQERSEAAATRARRIDGSQWPRSLPWVYFVAPDARRLPTGP